MFMWRKVWEPCEDLSSKLHWSFHCLLYGICTFVLAVTIARWLQAVLVLFIGSRGLSEVITWPCSYSCTFLHVRWLWLKYTNFQLLTMWLYTQEQEMTYNVTMAFRSILIVNYCWQRPCPTISYFCFRYILRRIAE